VKNWAKWLWQSGFQIHNQSSQFGVDIINHELSGDYPSICFLGFLAKCLENYVIFAKLEQEE
jgi:hypothetical protein